MLLTDVVPSGLVPIAGSARMWFDDEGNGTGVEGPWQVVGQRVDFCVSKGPDRPVDTLRYAARVVTPGTYAWESVAIQSTVVPTWGRVVPSTTVEVASE